MYHVDLIEWLQKLFDFVCVCLCERERERERERQRFFLIVCQLLTKRR